MRHVQDKHGVNVLSCICAIDKATLPGLMDYWAPGVDVAGIHEFVGNALVMEGEKRTTDLRTTPIPYMEELYGDKEPEEGEGKEGDANE